MQKKLLTSGNVFKRTDGRWCGVVWYMSEQGERKRKSFSGTTKQEVSKKTKDYIAAFEDANSASHESKKRESATYFRTFTKTALTTVQENDSLDM